ncbi:MAG: leucine-rich repeat domain-containing protein [Eubacterium sp.]|nr:leucine-rich repeat domain-containing protein [Eubacterium sp.]
MRKKIWIILLAALCMFPVSAVTIKAENEIIENDETGIPDTVLYKRILKSLKKKKDDKLTRKEAEKVESLYTAFSDNVQTFRGIGCLKNLKELNCGGIGNKELEEIAAELSNLKWIIIRGYNEKTYSVVDPPVESRKKQIDSLEPLKNMKSLAGLSVSDNNLTNLNGIEGMKNLKRLKAENNQIVNAEGINGLKNLKELYLSNNQIANLNGINNLTKLTYLDLSNNRLTSVKGIGNLKKLEQIDLSGNSLTSVKGIEKLKKIKILPVQNNNLKSLGSIKKMKNLAQLYISCNQLVNIKGIQSLKNLKVLYLGDNRLKKADETAQLTKLENLSLYGNRLKKLPNLKKLKKLKSLNAEDNELKTLPDMKWFKGTDLRLKWNFLTKKEIRKKLPKRWNKNNHLSENQKMNVKITYLSPEKKTQITKDTTEIVGRVSPTIIQECIPQVYLSLSNGEPIGWDGSMWTMPEADKDGIFRLDGLDLKQYAGKEICLVLAIDYDIDRSTIDRFVVKE